MAVIFTEGFDKYGGVNTASSVVSALLVAGDWTTATGTPQLGPGLSATGFSLQGAPTAAFSIVRTLGGAFSRLIGGCRFKVTINAFAPAIVNFLDSGTSQCSITINQSTGTISLRNGAFNGTALATSAVNVTTDSIHYLEWDITLGNSAAYQCWLDGASIFSGTGDTTTTANNSVNQFGFQGPANSPACWFDDVYLLDTSGTVNNAPLLSNPRVETCFPVGDSAVQFGFGAGTLGAALGRANVATSVAANQMRLRPFTPAVNMTLNSISIVCNASNGAIQLRPLLYADSAGLPGALIATGTTVVGVTIGTNKTMPLTTPQALVAGTQYWLGFMGDTVLSGLLINQDTTSFDRTANVTFSSGAPSTAPATSATTTTTFFGNVTVTGLNWYEVAQQPPPGILSYVFDSVVGHEDLYDFNALSSPPAAIYAVAVKAYCAKSDAGVRTVSMRMKSGATDNGGSLTGQAMGTSFAWLTSYFTNDPATGSPWTPANLNAAKSGFRIDS